MTLKTWSGDEETRRLLMSIVETAKKHRLPYAGLERAVRLAEILERRRSGETLAKIGVAFGLSRQRILQIIKEGSG